MKKTHAIRKQLAAAVCMTAVAALALGTSTFAWFVNNNQVTAEGMDVKALAESGIVITNSEKNSWKTTIKSSKTEVSSLIPGSTANAESWWYSKAEAADSHINGSNEYNAATENINYVKHVFYVKSSSTAITDNLVIKNLTVNNDKSVNPDLSPALRVGIKIADEDKFYIFAPYQSSSTAYDIYGGTLDASRISVTPVSGDQTTEAQITLPAVENTDGVEVDVFVWFEGEDSACKSTNMTGTLATYSVSVDFALSNENATN